MAAKLPRRDRVDTTPTPVGRWGHVVIDVLVEVILPVFAVAVVGGIVGRRIGLARETMQRAVFFIFSPALVFVGLRSVDVEPAAIGRVAVVCITVFATNAAVALGWSRLRRHDPRSRVAMAISSSAPNQGNLGLPIAALAFGAAGFEFGTLLFAIGIVMQATFGITLGTMALGNHSSRRHLAFTAFRYPMVYAAIAGAIANVTNADLHVVVDESTATLAQAAVPMMLVLLGLSFERPSRANFVDPGAASLNRLLLGPAVAWAVAAAIGLDGVTRNVTILMMGMPAAVNTTIVAGILRANSALSVSIVVLSTGLSLATLAALITML